MTDHTPTRDEAVLRYYADTFCELGAHHECCGKLNKDECSGCLARSVLASAPAPASGGVHAVREALLGYVLKPGQYETASVFARGQNRVAVDMLGVLDEASLSPAATPVSEAGGAALALDSEMRNAEFETWARKNGCHLHLHEDGEDRRYGYDLTERAWLGWCAALAKPDIFPSADEAARILRDRDACRSNLGDAWAAMRMIREAVETLGPIGAMPAEEHLAGPTFLHEAEAIVAGIMKMKVDQ